MTVQFGDTIVAPRAQQLKQVLAVLLFGTNEPVSVTTLSRELWSSAPPASAVTTIQTYILNLRKSIANALQISTREVARSLLRTERNGYCLRLPPEDLDLAQFQRLTKLGSRALAVGDAAASADLLGTALDFWRGKALADVQTGEVLTSRLIELDLSRLAAVEQRITADLMLGRHYEVLGELRTLVLDHPFNEALHAQYMLALYRTGRRAEALMVYQRLRDALNDQMGLDPIPCLQDIHRSILNCDGIEPQGRIYQHLRAVGGPLPLAVT